MSFYFTRRSYYHQMVADVKPSHITSHEHQPSHNLSEGEKEAASQPSVVDESSNG